MKARPLPPDASPRPGATRIAVLLPNLRAGGAERLHLSLANDWLARGFEVEFVLLQPEGELLAQLPPGTHVHALQAPRFRQAIRPLVRYLRHNRPAVLLAAMWPLTSVAVLAARLACGGTRVVISDHSILSRSYAGRGRLHRCFMRLSMAATYGAAAACIGVSGGVARDQAALAGIDPDRVTVIHNPAALGQFDADATSELPTDLPSLPGPLILCVGTLKAVKDHALLVEAFARLPDDLHATLCILGEGELRGALEAQVRGLGLQGRVLLPGYRADPYPYYRQADLFVLSSRHEGFGNVIVEALECGVPVVSTDCPTGPREILQDGRYGRLVPMDDPAAFAAAMAHALQESHDVAALQARASDFLVESISTQYLELLFPDSSPDDRA